MASRSGFDSCIILSACCCFVLALAQDTADEVLKGINSYRTQVVGVGELMANAGASCVAKKVLSQFEGTACSNTTGLDTVPGQEPNYPSFPTWLSDCSVGEDRVKDGQILPDCVPSASNATAIAILNYTHASGAVATISDTAYTSAGAASSTNWFVLILATNTSSGDYFQQSGSNSNLGSPTHVRTFTLIMPLLALLSLLAFRTW